jgi:trimeric autotransporter adhesin
MGRFGSVAGAVAVFLMAGLLPGCSSSPSVVTTTTFPTPAKINLTPTPEASLEIGKTLTFSGSPQNSAGSVLSEPVFYQSSNTAVLTVSTSGLACAGSWDSLTNPQICTPGPAGVVQVVATVSGVSSPPTTVYVHQHVDSIVVNAVPTQAPPTSPTCFSKGQVFNYQATAFSRGTDITSFVGPFTWQAASTTVVTLDTATSTKPIAGLQPSQTQATANSPGVTSIFASAAGVTSMPFTFTTCPVQSIKLSIPSGSTTANLARGGSVTITPTVVDSQGTTITGVSLTWCSSDPASVGVGSSNCTAATGSSMTATASQLGGGASIIAACIPPSCNIGFQPAQPIYPESAIQAVVAAGTASAAAWVTSTDCGTTDGCVTQAIPINVASSSTTTTNTLGTAVNLPATPNSIVFTRQGTRAYLGTNLGELGTKGLMVLDPANSTAAQFTSVVGKVLAVSPNGNTVIVSDTLSTPNQVYVFNCASTTGSCSGTGTSANGVALGISGATAADFSPDGLKAYILAGNNLYVYSATQPLQTVPLSGVATGVSFFPEGAFAYVAGEQSSTVTVRKTCDNTVAFDFPPPSSAITPQPQIITLPGTPVFIKPLPNSTQVLAVDPPGIDLIDVSPMDSLDDPNMTTTGTNLTGCAPPSAQLPSGLPAIHNGTVTSISLGQGNFTPTQVLISPDGSAAYLLAANSGSVLVFNINARTTSGIQLMGNAAPLQASLSQDGSKLFVAASDGLVHILDTANLIDTAQVSFPENLSQLQGGLCSNVAFTCRPNLIAVQP